MASSLLKSMALTAACMGLRGGSTDQGGVSGLTWRNMTHGERGKKRSWSWLGQKHGFIGSRWHAEARMIMTVGDQEGGWAFGVLARCTDGHGEAKEGLIACWSLLHLLYCQTCNGVFHASLVKLPWRAWHASWSSYGPPGMRLIHWWDAGAGAWEGRPC